MDFLNDHLTLAQPNKVSFSFNGLKLPNNTDIYFRAKQKEIVEQYSAARLFLQETECKDWDHWFIPHNDDKINEAFKLMLKSYFYEAALMYYNILVDLSWTICYLSVEFSMQVEGKRIDFDGLKSIEEATALLRKAENLTTAPTADTNPFEYLKRMSPQFEVAINLITAFWNNFSDSSIRKKYNYCKHKGKPCYLELESLSKGSPFAMYVQLQGVPSFQIPSAIQDIQLKFSLEDSICELLDFDNNMLFPYLRSLISNLENIINPSPIVF